MTALPEAWQDHAACAGLPEHIFFPDRDKGANTARAICATCPVRRQCLAWALDVEAGVDGLRGRHGIFGGMTATERAQLHRRKYRA